jgi:Holliday junction resolvase-like predicted endonuclease
LERREEIVTDLIEEVVAHWLFSKGYFLMNNLRVGANEIDLLAAKIYEGGIVERIHIEIQCSTTPVGYIGGSRSAKKRSETDLKKGVSAYIQKKFLQKKDVVESFLGKEYERWFICGRLKDESGITVEAFRKQEVKVIRVWDLLGEYLKIIGDKKKFFRTAQGARHHQLFEFWRIAIAPKKIISK